MVLFILEKAGHTLEVAEELKRKDYHSDAAGKVYATLTLNQGKKFVNEIKSIIGF